MKKQFIIGGIVLLVAIFGGQAVIACGGFFCTTAPIDQSAERIIFTMNGDETMSAIVGINYEGSAEDFSWVVPVPSPPELDVAPTSALDVLQTATTPRMNPPRNYCEGVTWSYGGFGGGGGDFLEEGNVGPYDYAIIASDNPSELIDWLRDNGYQVTEDMEPIIAEYVIEGMYFLAMKLSNDAEVGDIEPVKMTYTSSKPMIPIRLTAVAALDDMPVLVWILADQPYSPENYAHPEVDFASFRTTSQLQSPWGFDNAGSNYRVGRNRIQTEYDGQAFITEYALPTGDLLNNATVAEDPYLAELLPQYPFITRLRAQLSPEQMTLDPTFIPDPAQEHVSQVVELSDYVDPLQYWGCTNREFDIDTLEEQLPNEAVLTYENFGTPYQVKFRFPEGWVVSESLSWDGLEIDAYAPQPVTLDDVRAFFDGESTFPIVLRFVNVPHMEWHSSAYRTLLFDRDYRLSDDLTAYAFGYNRLFSLFDDSEMVFLLLTTDDDFRENIEYYRAMDFYLTTYTYATHPNLRYTLAIADSTVVDFSDESIPSLMLGFPQGWTESLQADGRIVITPDMGGSAQVEIQRSLAFSYVPNPTISESIQQFMADFGLSEADIEDIQDHHFNNCFLFPVVEYERGDRRGYMRIAPGWLITADSATSDFSANQDILRWIAESVSNGYGCMQG